MFISPFRYLPQCELLVDSFFDDIWKELEAELVSYATFINLSLVHSVCVRVCVCRFPEEPDVICAALRLCNSSAVAVSGAATAKSASLKVCVCVCMRERKRVRERERE